MIKKLLSWWKSLFVHEKIYRHRFIDEVPEHPNDRTIYMITHKGYCWEIVMICPCGCGKLLHMNAIKDHHPHWKFEIHSNRSLSLHPSIHRQVGCKSHFYVRCGKINWCR